MDVGKDFPDLFEQTFKYAPSGVALVKPDGGWMQVNQALCDMLGYKASELYSLTFQDVTHPDDLLIDLEKLNDLIAGKINGYQIEKRYITKKKSIAWAKLSVSLVRNRDNSPAFFISHVESLQTQKELEERLRHEAEQLSEKNEELEAMNRAMLGRELKMVEMKEEIAKLKGQSA